ncbi:MAG: phenylalanine--tRNA ligase subunit beta [Candidatus Brocadiae bacterium]|nr:phenylalanine--tRNA ligase subunit beta [Candidatus Brocadiia bacterium]
MKLTWDWLNEYCRTELPVAKAAELLTRAGVKVEGIEEKGGETVLELEITANRPDCLSLLGVAREASVVTGKPMREPALPAAVPHAATSPDWTLDVQDRELCPRYIGRVVRGVRPGSSTEAVRRRLEAIGLRPVNAIVDVTNFVLYECGQPLHAFDLDRLAGHAVQVRRGRPGEKLKAIDGRDYDVAGALVIADAEKPVAIAGVMGGKDTEVTAATTRVLLEAAVFDPLSVRRTSMKLALASDASYRFQRGLDPARVDWASRRAAALMAEFGRGQVAPEVLDSAPGLPPARQVRIATGTIARVLGREIEPAQSRRILELLGFTVQDDGGGWTVTVPSWRGDVSRDVDIVEEVARVYGYDRIPDTPRVPIVLAPPNPFDEAARETRRALCGAGFGEVLTLSFTGRHAHEAPFLPGEPVGVLGKTGKREELMRQGLVPSLLEAVRTHEAYGEKGADLFEIAKVYARDPRGFQERMVLGVIGSGGFSATKGALEQVLERLGLAAGASFRASERGHLVPGRTAELVHESVVLGALGEVDPALCAVHDVRSRPVAAELDFEALVDRARLARRFQEFPTLPAIQRDIAVILDRPVSWAEVAGCVRAASSSGLLESIRFFDLYEGKGVPAGKKSIAFSVTLRAPDRTLTSEEADREVRGIVEALGAKLGGILRG